MPAKDAYKDKTYPETGDKKLNPNDGPAVKVDPKVHEETSSYGSGRDAVEYREEIADLLDQGKWRDAMAKEIKDLRSASKEVNGDATRYNEGVREMLEYAKGKGFLDKN
jgi:hypothetical protein